MRGFFVCGTINLMKKNINDVVDQLNADSQVRTAINLMVNKIDERTKKYLLRCYSDPELLGIYQAMREQDKIDRRMRKAATQRKVVSFPNQIVYNFLDDLFRHKYGDNWLLDTPTLMKIMRNEDLIKPWIISKI